MYTSTQRGTSGISSGSIDALRVQLMKMNAQQLQAFATANQDDAIKLSLAAEADKYKKQHGQEALALMSGQQQKPPISQQILQSIGQPPQQQPMSQQSQGMPSQMAQAPQEMPPQQMAQGQMPPQGMAYGGDVVVPEDQGIATLPVGNMDFAEGGIVAFGGGGGVPGYAGGVFTGDPVTEYLKKIGLSAQEFINMLPKDQQKIRAAAAAAKPVVPSPAVPVAQSAVPTPVKPSGLSSLSRAVAPLAAITDLMYPSSDAEKKASLPYKLGAQSAVDERNTNLAVANENPEDYAARKVAEMEAAAGKQLSPDARNMAMSNFVKEKIANNVSKGATFTTEKQLTPAPAPVISGQDGASPAPTAPTADDVYLSGLNKLLKSSQTAGSVGPIAKLDAKRYSFTPAEMAEIKPEDFAKAMEAAMPKDPTASPLDARQQTLNTANVASRQKYADDLAAQFEKQGLAFKDTLEKLTSKEARVKTMEDNQLGMSMLEAGLNMMAGESPHAMVNIGKGAQAGTKKYMEIQDKVESARDKIDDAKMKIEEFRRNEANMNAREQRLARKDVDDAVSTGAQAMLNLAQQEYNLNRQQAISFVSNSMQMKQFNVNQKNQAEIHNQSTAANIDTAFAQMANQRDIEAKRTATQLGVAGLEAAYRKANPPAGSLEFYKQLGGGDATKGLEIFSKSLGPSGKGDEAILLDWQKKSPIEKQMARKLDPIGSAQLDRLLQERVLQGSISDKPTGSVLDQR